MKWETLIQKKMAILIWQILIPMEVILIVMEIIPIPMEVILQLKTLMMK